MCGRYARAIESIVKVTLRAKMVKVSGETVTYLHGGSICTDFGRFEAADPKELRDAITVTA